MVCCGERAVTAENLTKTGSTCSAGRRPSAHCGRGRPAGRSAWKARAEDVAGGQHAVANAVGPPHAVANAVGPAVGIGAVACHSPLLWHCALEALDILLGVLAFGRIALLHLGDQLADVRVLLLSASERGPHALGGSGDCRCDGHNNKCRAEMARARSERGDRIQLLVLVVSFRIATQHAKCNIQHAHGTSAERAGRPHPARPRPPQSESRAPGSTRPPPPARTHAIARRRTHHTMLRATPRMCRSMLAPAHAAEPSGARSGGPLPIALQPARLLARASEQHRLPARRRRAHATRRPSHSRPQPCAQPSSGATGSFAAPSSRSCEQRRAIIPGKTNALPP